ncbi:MAG: non-homologous end-joining DNA ligase [Gemmatimonadaceae bacterium]
MKRPDTRKRARADAATRRVEITHPDKVLFPDDGITKADLAEYYRAIAPAMLPHIVGRPVTLERFNRGITGPQVYQKNVVKGFPSWLERVEVPKKDGSVHHVIVRDEHGLQWLANQNSITPHVWTSRVPKVMKPDVAIFDLDPSDDDDDKLRAAALLLRDALDALGMRSWVKTSGSKGLHIAVPLDARSDYGAVARFAHGVGALVTKRHPTLFTREFYKKDRGDRILVDTGRNDYSATFAAAYAVRPRAGAPVSAPCTWKEIEQGTVGPTTFTLRNLPDRVAKLGDLWGDLLTTKQTLRRRV